MDNDVDRYTLGPDHCVNHQEEGHLSMGNFHDIARIWAKEASE